jgi:hypothetical protein
VARWALLAWQLKGELGLLLGECATQVEIALEERADAGQDGGVAFHHGWSEWEADDALVSFSHVLWACVILISSRHLIHREARCGRLSFRK